LATLCAYTSPNCALIRAQNSVKRTRPGYCQASPGRLGGAAGKADRGCGGPPVLGLMCSYFNLWELQET
jgi:hypothetical protein